MGFTQKDGKQMVWQEMLQRLLADRFKLTSHWEQREYTFLRAGSCKGRAEAEGGRCERASKITDAGSLGDCTLQDTLAGFARFMGFVVMDKPVVDKTGLAGEFDFTLRWTPDETQFAGMGVHVPPPVDNPNAPPGLFTAIQEQLGLKLEVRKTMTKVFVIDRAERPSEN